MSKGIAWVTTSWLSGLEDPMRHFKRLETEAGLEVRIESNGVDRTEDELVASLPGVVVTFPSNDPYNERTLAAGTHLKHIARTGVGFNSVDLDAATRHGVVVTNAPGQNSDSVAEHALGLMLCIARNIALSDKKMRAGEWADLRVPISPLRGKTLGIIGLGNIGKRVARRAVAFGMEVIANDIVRDERFAAEVGVFYEAREEVTRRADFITCHVPLNEGTRGMVDEKFLSSMKPGAYLVNTSRGPVVDLEAAATALERGIIQGAALDVFPNEPADHRHRIFSLDNVILTPHIAGLGEDACEQSLEFAVAAALDVIAGRRPAGLLNPEVLEKADIKD